LIDEAVAKPTWKRPVAAEQVTALAQMADHSATGEAADADRRNQESNEMRRPRSSAFFLRSDMPAAYFASYDSGTSAE
jgi:hypothetical protein